MGKDDNLIDDQEDQDIMAMINKAEENAQKAMDKEEKPEPKQ